MTESNLPTITTTESQKALDIGQCTEIGARGIPLIFDKKYTIVNQKFSF